MSLKTSTVHASAQIDATAELGAGVVIEPDAYIGPRCVIGAGTRIMARAVVLRDTVLGADNVVHPYAVLGGDPQDVKFDEAADPGRLEIGDGNQIREHVTINRGAGAEGATRIGSHCFVMAGAHVGHNAKVGDGVILTNQAAVAGHVWIDDGAVISAQSLIHQFVRVGRNVMMQGNAIATMHVPPFVILSGRSQVSGLNRVGLRRSGVSREEIAGVRAAFDLFYRRRSRGEATMAESLRDAASMQWPGVSREFVDFVRWALEASPPRRRGLCPIGRDNGGA